VLHEGVVHAIWGDAAWSFDVGVPSKRPTMGAHDCVVYGPDGRVLVGVSGRYRLLDARNGEVVAAFTRGLRSRVVRRGVLGAAHGHRIVFDDGNYQLFDPATKTVVFEMSPAVRFMGRVNTDAVGPSGKVLEVAGTEGMDAGWSESFDLQTGASLGRGGSGYGIDAIEIDANDQSLGLDDYMGLFGSPHGRGEERVHGHDLWLCGDVLYVSDSEGVRRLDGPDRGTRFACPFPRGLCASDDGAVVAVIVDGAARFLGSRSFS
jgi:hypothetical protein